MMLVLRKQKYQMFVLIVLLEARLRDKAINDIILEGGIKEDESINLSKIDDEAYIKSSLEICKNFNDTTSGKLFCTLNHNIVVMNNMLIHVKIAFL